MSSRKNPVGTKLLWVLSAAAAATVGAVALVAYGNKSSAPVSLWNKLVPNPVSQQIALPGNATFAIGIPSTDPNASGIMQNFTNAQSAKTVIALQAYAPGAKLPASYPNDGLGPSAYRLVGTVGTAATAISIDQSTQAYLWAGVA